MDDLLFEVSNECFLCGISMETSQISVTYSLRKDADTISTLIEEFTGFSFTHETLIGSFVCKTCFHRLQEYDKLIFQANDIRNSLLQVYNFTCKQPDYAADSEAQSVWESPDKPDPQRDYKSSEKAQKLPLTSKRQKIPSRRDFSCDYCGKSVASSAKLRDHLTVHTGERNFKCSFDGLMFKTQDNLNQHLLTHSVTKYECDNCGRYLKTKQTLYRHMTEHRSEKFECLRCGKKISKKDWFIAHLNRHNEERKFVCDFADCGKRFYSKQYLTKHKKVHEAIKHECPVCEKSFTLKYNMKIHVDTVHKGVPKKTFNCSLCDALFVRKFKLRDHLELVHHVTETSEKD